MIGQAPATSECFEQFCRKVHVVPWGLYVPARVVGEVHGDQADAEIDPKVELRNSFTTQKSVRIFCMVKDQAGHFVVDQDRLRELHMHPSEFGSLLMCIEKPCAQKLYRFVPC